MRHCLTVAVIECGLIGQGYGQAALFLVSECAGFLPGAALPEDDGANAG